MDKRSKIIIGLFAAVLVAIIVSEIVRPKPLNWKPSYTATDKIPFGCYVLFNELGTLFPNNDIINVNESLYNLLSDRDSTVASNYMLINNGIDLDEQESNELLDYVADGNTVFIASSWFGQKLSDTLNLSTSYAYTISEDSIYSELSNPAFKTNKFTYKRAIRNQHFTSVDSLNTTILGTLTFTEGEEFLEKGKEIRTKPNFIKVAFGNGNFYLNSTPEAFSNYYMLNNNQEYVANAFSYLDNEQILYWDNYKKSGRVYIESPMRFVLNQPALKWAYYIAITALLIFVFFKAKREQRIIPVIEPLENSSIEFAKTIGTLYHQHKDFSDLIAKKLNYFLEYIRSTFYINTSTITKNTAEELAAKSGKSVTETKELIDFIVYLKGQNEHTEQNLIDLNKKISSFKK
ncbi:DUF4350 domain-containing protein [Aurantibacter crassamenti]|uniref:DUF4350 domain-containing protein n=1 Tax=Aurantibacter crassamenti TaxID=1837375 RepID=UPI001939FA14|nr:DUF4350 domain-containing protein [Aurantibacter crassamenti]MBM1107895.1 DUF4350 domain-containing protein [Aurantibacter crassamenti]